MKPVLALVLLLIAQSPLAAPEEYPHPGTVVIDTAHGYAQLVSRLEEAVTRNGLGVVARASATLGARSLGIEIPGNMVIMVFHPRYAVRMLAESVAAGFEAPIRFYVTEREDGTARLVYRTPSSLFAPYGSQGMNRIAAELDPIFSRIATEATAR